MSLSALMLANWYSECALFENLKDLYGCSKRPKVVVS